MSFKMDASGDESHTKVGSGFTRLPAGRYHTQILEVDESFQKNANKIVISFEVLAGTIPGMEGKRHNEFFSMNAMDRLKRLAMVCDLIKPGEVKDVSFMDTIGKDLIIDIIPHSYEKDGKTIETTQMDFGGMFKVTDDEVKDVPRGKVWVKPAPSGNAPSGDVAQTGPATGSKWDNV